MFQPLTEICLRSLACLLAQENGNVLRSREIGEQLGISPTYAAKSLQPLEHTGWVRSVRGRKGGWQLLADPKTVSIADVVKVLEPHDQWKRCLVGLAVCSDDCDCAFHQAWNETVQRMARAMTDCSLDRINEFLPSGGRKDAVGHDTSI